MVGQRREWGVTEGEELTRATLGDGATYGFTKRVEDWAELGLDADNLLISRFCQVPLPVYPPPGGPRLWPGLRPEALWHPLVWVPPAQARVRPVVKTLGYARVAGEETDDAWAARIAHQLEAAALYDPDSGWTDVVAAATGRPVSEPPLLHRAGDWLAGAPDPVFDQQIPAWVARAWSVPGVADLPDQAGLWLAQALHGHNTHVHAANLAADMEWALGEVAGKPRGEAVRGLANIASATVTLAAQLVAEGEDDERKWYSLDQQIDGYEDAGALEDLAALAGGARDRLRHVAAQHESAYTGPRD